VVRENSAFRVAIWNNITLSDGNGWKAKSPGTQVTSAPIGSGSGGGGGGGGQQNIWLRANVNVLPGTQKGTFQYSTDGTTFANFGNTVTIVNDKVFFIG
jgi:hypothetical protein